MTARFLTKGRAAGRQPSDSPGADAARLATARSLFVTGGIGDVIALSSFRDLPSDLETIYYATPKRAELETYLSLLCDPQVSHVSVDDRFERRFAWYSLSEFERITTRRLDAADWSIAAQFPNIAANDFLGMPWLDHPLADVSRFALPERYAVLAPFSADKRDQNRDLSHHEQQAAVSLAACHGLPIYQIHQGPELPIAAHWLRNLSNQTNILESMAITLGASLFIGIDSAMSVVASKVLPADRLCIKTHNEHCRRWAEIYFAPHTSFEFLTADPTPRMESLQWTE